MCVDHFFLRCQKSNNNKIGWGTGGQNFVTPLAPAPVIKKNQKILRSGPKIALYHFHGLESQLKMKKNHKNQGAP